MASIFASAQPKRVEPVGRSNGVVEFVGGCIVDSSLQLKGVEYNSAAGLLSIVVDDSGHVFKKIISGGSGGGADAREIQLQKTSTFIQWRYVGDIAWNNLVSLAEITGPAGSAGANGSNGTNGKDVEIRNSGTAIEWRLVGTTTWNNIVSLSAITGPQGVAGSQGSPGTNGTNGTNGKNVELQKTASFVQWRLVGDVTWNNLVALSELTGPQGATGPTGATGVGVPTGGTTGQILAKSSNTDFATQWINAPTGGGGGTTYTFNPPFSETGGVVSFDYASATAASSIAKGLLTAADWNTFNSKQNQLNGTGFVKVSGTVVSYDNSTYYLASNPNNYISTAGEVDGTVSSLIKNIPISADATTNKYLNWNGSAYVRKQMLASEISGLATVATSGAYNDLTGKPSLFSGDYNDLTNKPTIPAQFNPIAGTNVSISGTYPNITFNATGGGGGGGTDISSWPYFKATLGAVTFDHSTFYKIPFSTVVSDNASGWNSSTFKYTIPAGQSGEYAVIVSYKLADNMPGGMSYGVFYGTDGTNGDFTWGMTVSNSVSTDQRNTIRVVSSTNYVAGDQIFATAYIDHGSGKSVSSATIIIYRIR